MIARIISNQTIRLDEITVWEENYVDTYFSASNPNSRFIDDSAYQNWDGIYRCYNRGSRELPRPLLAELRKMCAAKKLQLVVEDLRDPPVNKPLSPDEIGDDFLPGITLKPFQVDGIRKISQVEVGIISVTTGGGKGEMIAAACKALPGRIVVVADQEIVIRQLKERIQLREVYEEPGMFCSGKRPNGELIVIGLVQSLVIPKAPHKPQPSEFEDSKSATGAQKYAKAKVRYDQLYGAYRTRVRNAKAIHKFIQTCDTILVDECDAASGDIFKKIFRFWFKGRWRFGFSGTPFDESKPHKNLILRKHLGSVVFEQKSGDVESAGLIVPLEYRMVAMGDPQQKHDASAFDIATNDFIVNNVDLHRMAAKICTLHPDAGILILVERDDLGHALKAAIPSSEFVHGKTPKKRRPEIIDAYQRREIRVLIGGKNLRKGMDLKGGCEVEIIATGGAQRSDFIQRLGRARRLNSVGKSIIYDFLFYYNRYLYLHSRSRLKSAASIGIKTTVMFPHTAVDGVKFIHSRFRIPAAKKV